MRIKTIENFFSKTAYNDYWNLFHEPKWELKEYISSVKNTGAGIDRHIGDDAFYLSLYPAHIISRELNKEYYCRRLRLRVTWPNPNEGTIPHIDSFTDSNGQPSVDYDVTGVIHMKDSDGDLIIYNSIHPEPFHATAESIRITPKANTCIIMLEKYYHHAFRPVNSPLRYTVNINLKEAHGTEESN